MKKNMNKTVIFAATFMFSLFMGCKNNLQSIPKVNNLKNGKSITVSGSLSVANALPEDIAQMLDAAVQNNNEERSATSSFTQYAGKIIDFEVLATNQESGSSLTAKVTKDDSGKFSYSLTLNEEGTWGFSSRLAARSDKKNIDKQYEAHEILRTKDLLVIEVSKDSANQTLPLELYPVYDEEVVESNYGRVILDVYNSVSDVKYVAWNWLDRDDVALEKMVAFKDGKATFEFADIQAGAYQICLDFYDVDKVEYYLENRKFPAPVYTTLETINVFAGFVTDTWFTNTKDTNQTSASNLIKENEEDGSFKLELTQNAINSLAESLAKIQKFDDVYFSNYVITETPYILWNGQDEITHFVNENDADNITASYPQGIAVVNSIEDGTSLADVFNPYSDDEYNRFVSTFMDKHWFGFGGVEYGGEDEGYNKRDALYLYYYDDYDEPYLKRLKKSYSGYAYDSSFVVDFNEIIQEEIEGNTNVTDSGVNSLAFKSNNWGNFIFFYWYTRDSDFNYTYYFSVYCIDTKVHRYTTVENSISNFIIADCEFSTDLINRNSATTMFYYETSASAVTIHGKSLEIAMVGDDYVPKFKDTSVSYSLNANDLGYYTTGSFEIADMMPSPCEYIEDDDRYLYVLVNLFGGEYELYTRTDEQDGDGNPIYEPVEAFYTGNGGVIKLPIKMDYLGSFDSSVNFKPVEWHSGEGDFILGLYTSPNFSKTGTYYKKYYNGNGYSYTEACKNLSVVCQPPYDTYYFIGPRRFIAIKPDELVIADAGGYVETNGSAFDISNKNRVVTVNLKDASMSETKVDVTFTKDVMASGTGIYIK